MFTRIKKSLLASAIIIVSSVLHADDLDILPNQPGANPNILFVMDLSGSMDTLIPGTTESRVDVLRGAFQDVINDDSFAAVNFGLTLFSGAAQARIGAGLAHGITYPASPILGTPAQVILSNAAFTHPSNSYMPAAGTNNSREYLSVFSANDSIWEVDGATPLVDAFFEAASYFRGEDVAAGRFGPQDIRSAHPSTYTGPINNSVYNSPIADQCSANAIILLTDGAPTVNGTADAIANMIGPVYAAGCNAGTNNGRCGPELAAFLANEDQADGSTSAANFPDVQAVDTYPVGLSLDLTNPAEAAIKTYLDEIAANGTVSGAPREAIIASDRDSLRDAFADIIVGVGGQPRSFSAPSFSVDTSSLLNNGPFVYIPVFDRATSGLWPGNLKKYRLVNGILTDADGNPALDATNGLLDTARDLWSATPSTDSITSGGLANRITPDTRNILTDNGTSLIGLTNTIDNSNFGLTTSAADTILKNDLVTFISGINPADNTVRNHVGDIIHSKPVQLNIAGGRKIVFVGTNEGYLHAINDFDNVTNPANGTEAFAYMPQELLTNIKDQFSGVTLPEHIYGVDGLITVWIDESANTNNLQVENGVLDVASGERAYVFFGLRRGGGSYTAIEVTNPDSPRLAWSNSYGTGDSWSKPVVTDLKYSPNTTTKPVVIIGGGFNDDLLGNELAGGNNVYIIDALTGTTIWNTVDAFTGGSVTNFAGSSLPNAVPAEIRAIDVDSNDSIDRLYFGDTGGNIWRVDLNAAVYDADPSNDDDLNEATLHRVAALGGTGVNDRKFFESPDIAVFKRRGELVTSIAIGSGDRPNPLSVTVEDRFFVIYDLAPLVLPTDPLVTLGSGQVRTVPVSLADRLDPNFRGWERPLNTATGEKILSAAVTFQGKVLFNSLATTNINPDVCGPGSTTVNTLYIIDIFDGADDAVIASNNNDGTDANDNSGNGEIFGSPQIVFPETQVCTFGNCSTDIKINFGNAVIDIPAQTDDAGNAILDANGNPVSVIEKGKTLERVYWIDNGQ